jgi:hypothetical protein
MNMDTNNYYPGTQLERFEYVRIPVSMVPDNIMEKYNLHALVHNGYLYIKVRKGMYGLPQAGLLANVIGCLLCYASPRCSWRLALWRPHKPPTHQPLQKPRISFSTSAQITLTQKSDFIPQTWYYKLAATHPISQNQKRSVEAAGILSGQQRRTSKTNQRTHLMFI